MISEYVAVYLCLPVEKTMCQLTIVIPAIAVYTHDSISGIMPKFPKFLDYLVTERYRAIAL